MLAENYELAAQLRDILHNKKTDNNVQQSSGKYDSDSDSDNDKGTDYH